MVGIYCVDGPDRFTVVADIGAFSAQNPPSTSFFDPRGGQYALQPYRGGFLVTDGHHNRVLRVTLDGEVTEVIAFDNIVPTGLVVSRYLVYMAEAGPVPHGPEDGKVVAFGPKASTATEVASGAPLLVDVEFGPRGRLYALSQGRVTFHRTLLKVPRRRRTPARSRRATGTAASLSSPMVWTGRPRWSSSGIPRTSSPSPGRSGRSMAS